MTRIGFLCRQLNSNQSQFMVKLPPFKFDCGVKISLKRQLVFSAQ